MTPPKVVALEEHFTSPKLRVRGEKDTPVQRKREDLGKMRISEMGEAGIDLQVISENNPATQNLDAETAIKLARASNDLLYEPFQGLLFNFKNNSQAHAEKLSKFQVSSHGPLPAPSARCPHFGHVTFSSEYLTHQFGLRLCCDARNGRAFLRFSRLD